MPDRIGNITFLRLDGHNPRATPQLRVLRRSGIDGTAVQETGTAGVPFVLRSHNFAVNYAAAQQAYRDFVSVIGQTATLQKGDTLEPSQLYVVLGVVPVLCDAIVQGKIAGDATVYRAQLICDWLLLPIDPAVQPP